MSEKRILSLPRSENNWNITRSIRHVKAIIDVCEFLKRNHRQRYCVKIGPRIKRRDVIPQKNGKEQ